MSINLPTDTPTPAEMGRVAVLMGGHSAEREISLASGQACLHALREQGVTAEAFDPSQRALEEIKAFDRAFITLHGPGGEDGAIQGALESLGVPYTGSGVLGSALGMDKLRSKQIWRAIGLPTPAWYVLRARDEFELAVEGLGFPIFVKPLKEGSSLGTQRVDSMDALDSAWKGASAFGDEILVERCIEGAEYTVSILEGQALPSIRIEVTSQFYDFAAKYKDDSTRMHIPSGLSAEREQTISQLALAAFNAIDASGWGRVDVMADASGQFWLLEVNTVPGMTDHSLVPAAAQAQGMSLSELVWRILLTSGRRGLR